MPRTRENGIGCHELETGCAKAEELSMCTHTRAAPDVYAKDVKTWHKVADESNR